MKSVLLASLIGFCAAVTSVPAEYGTGVQPFDGEYYAFVVPDEMVERAPKWKDSEALPPLLPRDAAKAALQRLTAMFALIPNWRVEAITLKRVFPDAWIYLVEASDRSTSTYGIPWKLVVPVLMDGRTVPAIPISPDDAEVKALQTKKL